MKKRRVLLVNDMLNDFLRPEGVLYCGRHSQNIIPFVSRKIKEFRKKGEPVIFVCDAHRPGDYELKIYPPHAMKGKPGSRIIRELPPQKSDIVIEKRFYDGFSNPKLEQALRKLKISEVHVTGVCTSICIMETVSALFHRKIPVCIYKKGVSDFDLKNHRYALSRMKKIFGAKIL